MPRDDSTLIDAEGFGRAVGELADRIARDHRGGAPLALIGVRTRGVPIARRIADRVRELMGCEVLVGAVEITLYRDDLGRGVRWPVLSGTDIAFSVEGAEVVLVDDVLFTGRTIRAALNAICDLGRPRRVRLAVVVDRGGRELPIRADYAALETEVGPGQRIDVRVRPVDEVEGVFRFEDSTR